MKRSRQFYQCKLRTLGIIKMMVIGLLITILMPGRAEAQQSGGKKGFTVYGVIYEQSGRAPHQPYAWAVVSIPEYSQETVTNKEGAFEINNVTLGKVTLSVRSLGKVPIDTLINVTSNLRIELTMEEDNFRVEEVVVTASSNKAGQSTSAMISQSAMEHLQAASLKDVMSLMPGGLTYNPSLSYSGKINIRSVAPPSPTPDNSQPVGSAIDMNSLGISIVQDGAPMSANANLQSKSLAALGSTGSSGSMNPGAGIDARTISTENIESVEVIQGIASAEYGDVTSGVIIINSKAGRSPLRFNARTNPNVYQFSAGAGYGLGDKNGALNFGIEYSKNYNSLVAQYSSYQRSTVKLLYSNSLFDNKWRTNTSFDFVYGQEKTKQNPDGQDSQKTDGGTHRDFTLNTNGTIFLNKGWWKNIRYVASFNYIARDSYIQSRQDVPNFYYSETVTDGAILSNRPGVDLYDDLNNKITNIGTHDMNYYASYVRDSYLSRYDIEGREVNIFGKITTTFLKKWDNINNRILLGADFASSGNEGEGKTFKRDSPIAPSLSNPYSAFRTRRFKDVPYVNRLGLFVEDNLSFTFAGGRRFNLQAGVRYDKVSVSDGLVAPRINASVDIVPDMLSLKGGYGISGKMPTMLYLYPEAAYFEMVNLNTMTKQTDPEKQYLVTTTRVFDAQNNQLEIAKNTKAELGLDFRYERYKLSLMAFMERMSNGYLISTTLDSYHHAEHLTYKYDEPSNTIMSDQTYNVLLKYYTPTNNLVINTNGLEMTLDLGRFKAIRTAFNINGAWMRTENYNKDYTYYNRSSGEASSNQHVAIYDKNMQRDYRERIVTTLRATHNIPELGFVVTLTAAVTWKDADWSKFGNDTIPVRYISKNDGKVRQFPYATVAQAKADPEFNPLLRNPSENIRLRNSYPPLICFNINVTKEIGDFMRVSFFANNMFRSYPVEPIKQAPGTFKRRNTSLFFGIELALTIK